jgi:large subunit ribosomal protein L9e
MRYAYAHFPIQANIINGNKAIEIKNFIGEKLVRKIDALEGVTITRKEEEKDQIWVQGTSLENVSQTCKFKFIFRCFDPSISLSQK